MRRATRISQHSDHMFGREMLRRGQAIKYGEAPLFFLKYPGGIKNAEMFRCCLERKLDLFRNVPDRGLPSLFEIPEDGEAAPVCQRLHLFLNFFHDIDKISQFSLFAYSRELENKGRWENANLIPLIRENMSIERTEGFYKKVAAARLRICL